jgi:hypothetical protein
VSAATAPQAARIAKQPPWPAPPATGTLRAGGLDFVARKRPPQVTVASEVPATSREEGTRP